jgi:Arc/MetJ-type ribon-helix-helix transcriptional regulator
VPYVVYGAAVHKTTVYLPEDMRRRLDAVARDSGQSQAEVIRAALRAYLDERSEPLPASIGRYRGGAFAAQDDEEVLAATWGRHGRGGRGDAG